MIDDLTRTILASAMIVKHGNNSPLQYNLAGNDHLRYFFTGNRPLGYGLGSKDHLRYGVEWLIISQSYGNEIARFASTHFTYYD